MAAVAARSKLFHAIVIVGLSTASAGCGSTGRTAEGDGGTDGRMSDGAAASATDAPSEADIVVFGRTDASNDAGMPAASGDAGDAGPVTDDATCPSVRCWPFYV